jgi:acetoin utilization deacetylase AcuC-like enzyme
MVERVKKTGDYDGAVYSAAGTLSAALRIWSGEIRNAFVFTGYGDHHAGGDFFGGGCYFNGAAIAVRALRRRYRVSRLSIIDTDAHHGDGTWDLFANDPDLLYLCFCTGRFQEKNRNVNIQVPFNTSDDDYFEMVKGALISWIADFRPALIFWNWGYDGTIGDYGDLGLSPKLHLRLATEIKKWAHEVCGGRLIIVLCGGSRRDLATFLIPRMIEILLDPF